MGGVMEDSDGNSTFIYLCLHRGGVTEDSEDSSSQMTTRERRSSSNLPTTIENVNRIEVPEEEEEEEEKILGIFE